MRGATNVTLQTHQILRLPRKMTTQHLAEICGKQLKRHFQYAAGPRPFRAWSEQDPSRIREWSEHEPVSPQPAAQLTLLFALRTSILYWKIQHFSLRLSFQISPSTAPATKIDIWPSPSTAPATTKSDTWPSPITAPATKSDTWPSAEQQMSPPNSPNTAPATQNDHPTSGRNLWKTAETSCPMRGRSKDPSRIRDRSENEPVRPQPAAQLRLLFALRTSILYWKIQHFALRLSYFQISPRTAPATKSDTGPSPSIARATKSDTWPSPSTVPAAKSDTWPSPSTAPATKSDTWPSPSTAPATKSDTWPSPSTAPATKSDLTFTKYCTCYRLTLLLLNNSITWLYYYSAILFLDSTITKRFYYLTLLLLDSTIRFYYLTLLLLSDSITWLYYY